MTDEERQKLCDKLRYPLKEWSAKKLWKKACLPAANEIERLAARVNALEHIINLDMYEATKTALVQAQDEIERLAALVQSDAKPQETWNKQPPGPDSILHELGECPTQSDAEPLAKHPIGPDDKPMMDWYYDNDGVCRPSLPAKPRPDTSAGLIEASILLDNRADEYMGSNEKIEQGYRMAARYLRSRAADKSGK